MRNAVFGATALAILAGTALPASAGVYGDDVTRCIVKSTSDDDHIILVRWVFAAMALHPAIKTYASVSEVDRAGFNKQVGDMVTRLLTKDCRKETVTALKYEGTGFMEQSFKALGEIAMGGLMAAPEVNAGFAELTKAMDLKAIVELAVEAGRPPATPPSAETK
jgi:hypothetical protein